MTSLEKKIREIFSKINGEVKDQEFRVWSDLDYIEASDALVAIANVKKEVLEELGKVAQQIRERFQNAHVAPFGWLKNLQNLEKEVLGLLVEEGEK